MVESQGELVDQVELLLGSQLHRKILEVGDISLKTIIGGTIFLLKGALSEGVELIVGSDFYVKWVECRFKVRDKLIKSFLGVGDGGISHFVIPILSVRCSSSSAHLVQRGHDLGGIGGV